MKRFIRKENLKKIGRKAKWILRKAIFAIVFVEAFAFLLICELILCSQASFHDFFTSGKVSEFNNRPPNITKNIVVDALAIENSGGVKNLTETLIKNIAQKRPNWFFTFLCCDSFCTNFSFTENNVKIISIPYHDFYPFLKISIIIRDILNFLTFELFHDQITQLLFLEMIVFNKQSCDLVFDPCSNISVNDYSIPKVSIVHDIQPILQKKFNTTEYVNRYEIILPMVLKSSAKIVTVSDFTKNRLIDTYCLKDNFLNAIHIKLANRIKNRRNTSLDESLLTRFSVKHKNYLIYTSTANPYKNHDKLLQAFGKFLQKHKNSNLKLVIVGLIDDIRIKRLYGALKIICDSAEQYEYLKNRIVFTNFIPDEELSILLSNALAMIFPSLYEGFGMPVIEAMSAGIPVACSNVTSLPEVAGDAALLFDPYNVDDIEKAIEKITGDEKLREELIKKGYKRAEIFSDTDSMIDEYIKIFEECMSK